MNDLRSWILAARPKTLPAAVVPVWVGCVLGWKLEGMFSIGLMLATLIGAMAIQVATNFFNDALDAEKGADTEKRLGPQRVTASGALGKKEVYMAAGGTLFLAAICGVLLVAVRGPVMLWIGVPSLFLAYGYTGGPWPLAYKGLGEIFVVLFFGVVAVCGTVFVQLGEWRWEAVVLGLLVGLLSAVLITINNLRDEEEDRSTGKGTLVARFGRKWGMVWLYVEVYGAVLLALLMAGEIKGVTFWVVLPMVLGHVIIQKVERTKADPIYNRYLALGAVQLVLFACLFSF